MKRRALATAFTIALLSSSSSFAEYLNPIDFPQSGDPTDVQVVIEIPAGSFTKYELDAKTGLIFVDRFQSMPVVYPTNYGSIPSTVGPDGDPLDALVITRQPIYPGALIRVRPIGIMKMIDGGDVDDKIVAVPISKLDPTYDEIKTIDDLPAIERARIEQFFAVYKKLPDGRKVVEMKGFDGVNAAVDMLKTGLDKFKTTEVSTSAQAQ
ncbi:MAG: inorganic diphosphatase [Alphaproteobacteria bacterium]|nr:inorganic diphosphatase [Alphaproteobacteria bacterium]